MEILWLHIVSNGTRSVAPATIYRINGKHYFAHEIDEELDGFEYDDEAIRAFYDRALDYWDGLYDESQPDQLPTRIILRFRPQDQDFTADFHYGNLQPGVPKSQRTALNEHVEQWMERLQTTGNDSAAP